MNMYEERGKVRTRDALPIQIKKVHPGAKVPEYAHFEDSGFDLVIVEDVVLLPREMKQARTGLAFDIPVGYEMQIRMRSGAAKKRGLLIPNAPSTVDAGYHGEILILLYNNTNVPQKIDAGTSVCQGVICKVPMAKFIVVDEFTESSRGENGWGSTGEER